MEDDSEREAASEQQQQACGGPAWMLAATCLAACSGLPGCLAGFTAKLTLATGSNWTRITDIGFISLAGGKAHTIRDLFFVIFWILSRLTDGSPRM